MFSLIKNIFFDILILYKNFIHWNISKLSIYVFSVLLGVLVVLPFILIYLFYSIFSGDSFIYFVNSLVTGSFSSGTFGIIIHIIIAIVFSLVFLFSYLLLLNLNLSYLKGEKISYLKNRYLDKNLFLKYLLLTITIFGLILVPFVFFIILSVLLLFSLGGIEDVLILVYSGPINAFSILVLLFFIVSLFSAIYIFYRTIFSYFLLLDDTKYEKKISALLKESVSITKGYKKLFKSILVFLVFGFFYLAFSYAGAENTLKYSELKNYQSYISLDETSKEYVKSQNNYYYSGLEVKYAESSLENINNLANKYFYLNIIFTIFEFLVLYGFFSMVLTSTYLKIIKETEIKKESKISKIVKKLNFKNKEL